MPRARSPASRLTATASRSKSPRGRPKTQKASVGATSNTTETDVCVIGAGWSGLYAMKYALAYGLSCIGVERRYDVGGLWYYDPESPYTTANNRTFTSSPKDFTEAIDYPWPDTFGYYATGAQIHIWLKSYASHFGLLEKIRLSTAVTSARKTANGIWEVQLTNVVTQARSVIYSKYLIICAGVNANVNDLAKTDPKYAQFSGETIHSHVIRRVEEFQDKLSGKNIVCIGGGENACDLSYYLSMRSRSYTLCIPTGQWMQIRNFLTNAFPISQVAPVTPKKLLNTLPWEYQKVSSVLDFAFVHFRLYCVFLNYFS
jgi:cation diffusion facilitator CzcD-associated flavoprotein CzcO